MCDVTPQIDYFKNFKVDQCLCLKCMVIEKDKAKYESKTKSEKMKRLDELENQYQVIFVTSSYQRIYQQFCEYGGLVDN